MKMSEARELCVYVGVGVAEWRDWNGIEPGSPLPAEKKSLYYHSQLTVAGRKVQKNSKIYTFI